LIERALIKKLAPSRVGRTSLIFPMWAQLPYLMGSIIEKDTSSAAGAASIGQLCTHYVCEFDQQQIGRNRSHQLPTLAPINKWKEGAKTKRGWWGHQKGQVDGLVYKDATDWLEISVKFSLDYFTSEVPQSLL
jgi:hypothetical protein